LATTTRKFAVAYVMLVGLPILGLLGVLRHGRNLSAPVGMDGNWVMQGNLSSLPCGLPDVAPEDAVLKISQSGQKFELTLPNGLKTQESGTLDGTSLNARLVPPLQSKLNCRQNQTVTLVANLNKDERPRTLEGSLVVDGCTSCSPVLFTAVRQKPVAKKGAH